MENVQRKSGIHIICVPEKEEKHENELVFKIITQEEFLEIRENLNLHNERVH